MKIFDKIKTAMINAGILKKCRCDEIEDAIKKQDICYIKCERHSRKVVIMETAKFGKNNLEITRTNDITQDHQDHADYFRDHEFWERRTDRMKKLGEIYLKACREVYADNEKKSDNEFWENEEEESKFANIGNDKAFDLLRKRRAEDAREMKYWLPK